MPASALPTALQFVHQMTTPVVSAGDVVVDATVGNGHDTAFLAGLVGPKGRVIGFDVQAEALDQARLRLDRAGVAAQVTLIHAGHEALAGHLERAGITEVSAVMFNLGYLPGGDKARITRPETTLPALEAALAVLAPGGVMSVVLYTGHPGGPAEAAAVEAWAAGLDQAVVQVLRYGFLNQRNRPPYALLIERVHG